MEHKDTFLLEMIIEYCDKIASYFKDNDITEKSFLNDPYFQDTCAFYCLQIGELAKGLSNTFLADHPDMEWRNIINLRNIIAHEYGNIDSSLLWDIIQKNIPELHTYCSKIVKLD